MLLQRAWTASSFFLLSVLFFLSVAASAADLNFQLCPPSSCGHLRDIRYPFRLKTDPPSCGNPNYELSCDANTTTILKLFSHDYSVVGISYTNSTIHLIDVSLAHSTCLLPPRSLSYSKLTISKNYRYYRLGSSYAWASFVSCSNEIDNNSMYTLVPCLSSKNNSSYVYVIVDEFAFAVSHLASSCRYPAMIPFADAKLDSNSNVFELLAEGFTLSWDTGGGLSVSTVINSCIKQSKRMFKDNVKKDLVFSGVVSLVRSEKHFLSCLQDYTPISHRFKIAFRVAIAVVVLILMLELLIVLAILGRFVFAPLIVCVFLSYKLHKNMTSIDTVEKFLRNQPSLTPTRYAYTDIIAITSHFRERLGQGGFGSVFKGRLPGNRLVAVKMLSDSRCNGEEFINEVSTIGRIHHVNVVKLIGFCSDGSQRALVYEYMPNGSLDKFIFSPKDSDKRRFSLERLNEIAIGVARGIDYLHQGCDMQILHFDIKPHNILLDHNFIPKVSDFGLAKLYPKDYSLVTVSAARGTIGYIAPELISRNFGVISYKSDVYSFGMLLLEMAGGRRNADPGTDNTSEFYYPSWIYDQLSPNEKMEFRNDGVVIQEAEKKSSVVGLWCIQMRPCDRPSMSKVLEMLEADVETLAMPPKPFISVTGSVASLMPCLQSSSEVELAVISEDE